MCSAPIADSDNKIDILHKHMAIAEQSCAPAVCLPISRVSLDGKPELLCGCAGHAINAHGIAMQDRDVVAIVILEPCNN